MSIKALTYEQGMVLDHRRNAGTVAAYYAATNGGEFQINPSTYLELIYRPPVNCWWDTHFYCGIFQKLEAAYGDYAANMRITPADADGYSSCLQRQTLHSTYLTYGYYDIRRVWKLTGGVNYTLYVLHSINGGTYQYYQAPSYLFLEATAYPR